MPRRKLEPPEKKLTAAERRKALEDALSIAYQLGKYFMEGMIEASREYQKKQTIESEIKDREDFNKQ